MTFKLREKISDNVRLYLEVKWAFPWRIFVTHLLVKHYVLMWENDVLLNSVVSLLAIFFFAFYSNVLTIGYGLPICTHVEVNFPSLLEMDDTLSLPDSLSVENFPSTLSDWVMTLEPLIKKEAKRLNSANQQVNNLFILLPPCPKLGHTKRPCSLEMNWNETIIT